MRCSAIAVDTGNGHLDRLRARSLASHQLSWANGVRPLIELSAAAAEARDSHLSFLVYPLAFEVASRRLPSVHLAEQGGREIPTSIAQQRKRPIVRQHLEEKSDQDLLLPSSAGGF